MMLAAVRARIAGRLRDVPAALPMLLAVGVLEIVCWTVVAPPWQGPDEWAHFAYAQHFAEVGHAPSKSFPNAGVGSESSQQSSAEVWFNLRPLVGVSAVRPFWDTVDLQAWHRVEKQLPSNGRSDGYGPNAIAQNPPLYYAYESVPYKLVGAGEVLETVFWMRIWTGLLFLMTIGFTWLAAGELFGARRWLQALAAAAVTLQPQLAYVNSIVNPDAALVTIWSAFTWLALRLLRRGPNARRLLAIAVVASLSAMTHGRGLPLVAPAAAAVALTFIRHRRASLRTVVAAVSGALLVGLALLWTFHITPKAGGAAYGGEAHLSAGGFSVKGFLNYVWQFYLPGLPGMNPPIFPGYGFKNVYIDSFFGTFASLEIVFPSWVFVSLEIAEIAGLIVLIGCLIVRRRALRRRWDALAVMALMFVSLVFVLHFVAYRDLLVQPADPVLVGRYILPLVTIWALGIATVAAILPRRLGVAIGTLVVTVGALLQVAGLGLTLTRFYG